MKLIFDDPGRPQDEFVINDRTDSDNPIVKQGETFTVLADRGRFLIAHYFPRLKPVQEAKPKPVARRAAK